MQKSVTGFCPESNRQQTITVTFECIRLGGGLPPSNKVMSYSCPYAMEHGCNHNGPDGRSCPLLQRIQD